MTNEHNRFNRQWSLLAILALMLAVIAPVEAHKYPDITEEGLVRIADSRFEAVYVMEGADFSGYDKILLEDASVAFRKNWQRDLNRSRAASGRVRDADVQKIKDELSAMLSQVFREELTEGGYAMVDSGGQDVLRIRPAIVDLDITAPDLNQVGSVSSYSESAGRATLVLELYDSETGALIAKGVDSKRDHHKGYMQWRTSVSNRADAKRALRDWARTLREGLDEARATSG